MKRVYPAVLVALITLTLLSLVLHGIVVYALLETREATHRVVGDARMLVSELNNDTFHYSVELEQDFPISTAFPFNETFTVPVNTVVPIDTMVVVPVDLGITTYKVRIPINTVFPLDMEFTVPVSQVVDVDMVVPVNLEVPVEIAVRETQLADYLKEVDAILEQTEDQLEGPIWER